MLTEAYMPLPTVEGVRVPSAEPPMEILLMPFGKHKGTPIAEMPKHYIEWALREMKDLDRDLVHTLNLALEKRRSQ